MATTEDIAALRVKIDEPTSTTYSDEMLDTVLEQADNNLDAAAAELWEGKAARYSRLVNVSESGSSRNMSDLHKNALAMVKLYADRAGSGDNPVAVTARPRTRAIVRP